MKKLLIILVLVSQVLLAQNDKQTTLQISEITVVDKSGNQTSGNDVKYTLQQNKNSRNNILFKNNEVSISANFKITGYNSRRSSVKTGAVKVVINYTSTYNKKKDKRVSEYTFYLDDERKFNVKENFVFKSGIKSYGLTLTYKGTFID